MTDEEVVFAEYVPFARNSTVPATISETWKVAEGQLAARGLGTPPKQAFVNFQFPTTLPPHAVNFVQSGPLLLLLLLEQPANKTPATSANARQLQSMDEPSLMVQG
jgi:hypothetical protein